MYQLTIGMFAILASASCITVGFILGFISGRI